MRSAVAENPTLYPHFTALYNVIDAELLAMEFSHCGFDPMTFIYQPHPYSQEIHRMCKYELPTSRLSKVIVWQTDRIDRNYKPRRFASGQKYTRRYGQQTLTAMQTSQTVTRTTLKLRRDIRGLTIKLRPSECRKLIVMESDYIDGNRHPVIKRDGLYLESACRARTEREKQQATSSSSSLLIKTAHWWWSMNERMDSVVHYNTRHNDRLGLLQSLALCRCRTACRSSPRQRPWNLFGGGVCFLPSLLSVSFISFPLPPFQSSPLPSNKQHLSYDVCLEVRGEIIRTVLCCIV